ncbi:hypothetical protein [Serratia sp. M24T3]|uniref:hypothetical protein n=1 Tax=Serratia sp. M24T3 TaxID=932213 RepID=UPI00025BA80B|nr:hypothetical protein [Serratia sp. M24T3]EIC82167.1 Gp63 [Serratia sp. M24T3]
MFTVKTIIDGVTHISEVEKITIARAGSDAFKRVLELTNNTSNPDFAFFVPAVYEDAAAAKTLQDEELIISERDDVLDTDAIAIIIDDFTCKSERHPYPEGTQYQFIYPGDYVYVMNSHGSTIETVK